VIVSIQVMQIREDKIYSTEGWVGKEKMHDPPNWYGVSPEVISRRGKPWNQNPDEGPWLDREGAEASIQNKLSNDIITEDEAELLLQWTRNGYFILKDAIEEGDRGLLDDFVHDLDDLWTTDKVLDGLQIMSLHVEGRRPGPVDHAELLSWPIEKRLELRDSQIWRIHYYHPHSESAMKLAKAKRLLRMTELLLEENPVLINSIGFKYGSQVTLHQDLGSYHIHPANRLVGVWVACEDVNPEAGPLSVYPGTHRVPNWPGWHNYPQTNIRSCHLHTRDEQAKYLSEAVKGQTLKPLIIKKGDAIFQHGLQIHCGNKVTDRKATRFSMVIHYSTEGADRMHEVEGPFNW